MRRNAENFTGESAEGRWAKRFEIPVLVAAALVVPVVVIENTPSAAGWETAAAILNWMIWCVFTAEFIVLLAVSDRRGRWLRSHPLETAIVFLTPPFLPASLQAA